MEDLTGQLAELLEDITYDFSAHNLSTNCCENISHGEFRALRAVSRRDGCTMQDIARNIAVTKSGATRIVSRLEEKKLVLRVQERSDARICCVRLSKDGKAMLSRITEAPAKKISSVLDAMSPDMRQILLIGLRAFIETARAHGTIDGQLEEAESPVSKTGNKIIG